LFSALGLLAADVRATFSRSLVAPLDAVTLGNARIAAAALTEEARVALRQQGVPNAKIRTVVELDVRYAGQSFDLTIPFDGDEATLATRSTIATSVATATRRAMNAWNSPRARDGDRFGRRSTAYGARGRAGSGRKQCRARNAARVGRGRVR